MDVDCQLEGHSVAPTEIDSQDVPGPTVEASDVLATAAEVLDQEAALPSEEVVDLRRLQLAVRSEEKEAKAARDAEAKESKSKKKAAPKEPKAKGRPRKIEAAGHAEEKPEAGTKRKAAEVEKDAKKGQKLEKSPAKKSSVKKGQKSPAKKTTKSPAKGKGKKNKKAMKDSEPTPEVDKKVRRQYNADNYVVDPDILQGAFKVMEKFDGVCYNQHEETMHTPNLGYS